MWAALPAVRTAARAARRHLTVITGALDVAQLLAGSAGIEVIVVGGRLSATSFGTTGPLSVDTIQRCLRSTKRVPSTEVRVAQALFPGGRLAADASSQHTTKVCRVSSPLTLPVLRPQLRRRTQHEHRLRRRDEIDYRSDG